MQIQETDARTWPEITKLYANDNFFQQSDWLNLVADEFNLTNRYYQVTIANDLDLFLCIQAKNNSGYCNFIGYGGPISSEAMTPDLVSTLIISIEKKYGIIIKRMKLFPVQNTSALALSQNWQREQASILKITKDWDTKLQKQTKYSINYAVKNGVVTKKLNDNDISRFYEIYSETMGRVKSTYKTPESLFRRLCSFPNVDFVGAFINGRLEAVCVFLNQTERSYYWWACSSSIARKYNANYLIMFTEIKKLRQEGVSALDMASSNNEGVANFKAQWGAEDVPFLIYSHD